jgi:hypothetical protein
MITGRGADGRRDPGRVGGRRPDAADPRAHPARPSGRRSGAGGVPEQVSTWSTTPSFSSWSSWRFASFCRSTTSPATTSRWSRVRRSPRSERRRQEDRRRRDPRADGSGRLAYIPTAGASDRQAVPDADRRRVLDLGPRHGGDRPRRARHRQGWRGSRDRRHPSDRARRRLPASRCSASCSTRARPATTSARCCAASTVKASSAARFCAKPGSVKPHKKFKAEAYILTKEEGGRHTPFFTNYRPQFYFRTTDVTGIVHAAGRHRDGDAGRQRVTVDVDADRADRHGREAALRHPRRRPHRRRRHRRFASSRITRLNDLSPARTIPRRAGTRN